MSTDQLRVLCVDDEPKVLEGLENTLAWHYDVRLAPGGAEGMEMLQHEGPFAVVISDMRMPGMDGATFLANVYEETPDTTLEELCAGLKQRGFKTVPSSKRTSVQQRTRQPLLATCGRGPAYAPTPN